MSDRKSRAHALISGDSPNSTEIERLMCGCRSPPRTNLWLKFPDQQGVCRDFVALRLFAVFPNLKKARKSWALTFNSLLIGAGYFYCGAGKKIAWSAWEQGLGSPCTLSVDVATRVVKEVSVAHLASFGTTSRGYPWKLIIHTYRLCVLAAHCLWCIWRPENARISTSRFFAAPHLSHAWRSRSPGVWVERLVAHG
jgi:hypothetical protein